jgi:polyisoprenoid-binding protein YceI
MIRASILLLGSSLALTACVNTVPPARTPAPTSRAGAAIAPDKIWVTGTSNIRSFTCRARTVNVSVEAAPENFERTKSDGLTAVRSGGLQVPVRSLDCGIGLQNRHLFETLDAATNPVITFSLADYVVERSEGASNVRMQGLLRIAGTQRSLVVHGTVFRNASGQVILRGERLIDIRDFDIEPPRRFFGLLRVRNEVTVHFEVVVRPLIDPLGILVSSLP